MSDPQQPKNIPFLALIYLLHFNPRVFDHLLNKGLLRSVLHVFLVALLCSFVVGMCQRNDVAEFAEHIQGQRYNGKSAPALVLVSPIACEARPDLDAESANAILSNGMAAANSANPVELAAWASVSRVLLNLHETITRR